MAKDTGENGIRPAIWLGRGDNGELGARSSRRGERNRWEQGDDVKSKGRQLV